MGIKDLFKYFITRIEIAPKFYVVTSIIISTLLYIYFPFYRPIIRIDSNPGFFNIRMPYNFSNCSLSFGENTSISSYSERFIDIDNQRAAHSQTKKINRQVQTLRIDNLLRNLSADSSADASKSIEITIVHNMPTTIIINKVEVDDNYIGLTEFFEKNIPIRFKSIAKYRYIRNDISKFLVKYNDDFSNFVLTILAIYSIILFGQICVKTWLWIFESKLEKKIVSQYKLSDSVSIDRAKISLAEHYLKSDSWYGLLQVAGPAIGFIITISSLIVGLHPSVQSNQNMSTFFNTIQIAMVSTFLGLLIRILAIFLRRINNKLLLQADNIFFDFKMKFDNQKKDE